MPIAADQLGRVLHGRYRLDAGLGSGSSAHVYLAHDLRLGRPVAVKILHPGLSDDATFLRRFRSEAHAAATLNHPNIVQVHDWGEERDGPYLVLEYLAGGSLQEVLRTCSTLTVAQSASVGLSVARALEFAHRRGLVHRDIKPANLLFDEAGSVHVADFGLAKALSDTSWTEPQGIVLGTARYASPEQAIGQPLDARSDVYSLALVLYEAVVGSAPFVGDTAYSTLIARIGRALPLAPELGPLAQCLDAAARSDRAARIDAAAFADMLERVAHELPQAQSLSLAPRVALDVPASGRTPDADDVATIVLVAPDRDDSTLSDVVSPSRRHGASGGDAAPTTGMPLAAGDSDDEPHRTRRRLRRRVVLGAVALACLCVLLGALAIPRYLIFDHVVPSVMHQRLLTAERVVATNGLRLRVDRRSFSSAIPAGAILSQSPSAGQRERSGVTVSVVLSKGPAMVAVPRVVGKTKALAVSAIVQSHLVPSLSFTYSESVPSGSVVVASPSIGTARYGTKIALSVSLGPRPRTIPQFASTTYGVASAQLVALRLGPVEHLAYSNDVQRGDVISTDPAEGATGIVVGSRVAVTVSEGPRLVAVPLVANEPIAQAIAQLQQAGLTVNEQIGPPFATKATTTNPAPGAKVVLGSPVTLYVA